VRDPSNAQRSITQAGLDLSEIVTGRTISSKEVCRLSAAFALGFASSHSRRTAIGMAKAVLQCCSISGSSEGLRSNWWAFSVRPTIATTGHVLLSWRESIGLHRSKSMDCAAGVIWNCRYCKIVSRFKGGI
jgi:hypothetical protein